MSEMVERVAQAIHTLRNSTREQQARAAIKAMKYPTTEMIAAGKITAPVPSATWRDMVEQALK